MSISCYPVDDTQLHVDNPGYGYLELQHAGDSYTLVGPQIGAALAAVTLLATGDSDDAQPLPDLWRMSKAEATQLLRPLISCAIFAAAGGDRAERLLDQPEADEPARRPMCVRCDVDSVYASANPHPNPWCAKYGHDAYAFGDPSLGYTWARATDRYERSAAHAGS